NEYKLVKKELNRVANKVALATMKSLASFRDSARALKIDELEKKAIDTDVVLENLKEEGAKLGKKVDELREISSKQSKVNSEKEAAKKPDKRSYQTKLDAAETDNQKSYKNYLQSIKDSLESVEQGLDSVKQNELDQINHYIKNGEVPIKERILPIELKGVLEVKNNVFKLAGRVNKPGAKIKTSELIKYCKKVLAKKPELIEDDTYDLPNLRDKDQIEDYKEDQKGLVRLDLSVYRDGKEFTEEGIIKYYAKKLEGQNYVKKHYEKSFEDNQQEGF
ncbi:7093_t:CDS:2, partial [Funneliformis mosseae]